MGPSFCASATRTAPSRSGSSNVISAPVGHSRGGFFATGAADDAAGGGGGGAFCVADALAAGCGSSPQPASARAIIAPMIGPSFIGTCLLLALDLELDAAVHLAARIVLGE